MNPFNTNNRSSNAIKSSSIGVITNVIKVLMGFGYRTFFLSVLSVAYLGINGLFSNILQILSLAELGVTTAIVFRFYEPISKGDVAKVGRLMNFFKTVYHAIAAAIFLIGMLLLPFIPLLINESDTVPSDINLYVVYVLYIINTSSTYIFAYKLSLLNADQRNYQYSIIDTLINALRYLTQIVVLYRTANYTLTLTAGIVTTLVSNYLFSLWVTNEYKEVFEIEEKLEKKDQKEIFRDTKAVMYHKVGNSILTGTDSVVLTKMVSLVSAGIYSNYSLVIFSLQGALGQLFSNIISSVGNAKISIEKEDYYKLYLRLNFFGLWITSFTTVCLFVAIDDFISVWIGKEYLFDTATTAVLCIQYYLQFSSYLSMAFTNASGLFVKDKIRPLIESVINLIVSIVLAYHLGIIGVFLGTVISDLLTVFWRVPYVLYRYDFHRSTKDYWKQYIPFLVITILFCCSYYVTKKRLMWSVNWSALFLELFIVSIVFNAILFLIFRKKDEFFFIKELVVRINSIIAKRN